MTVTIHSLSVFRTSDGFFMTRIRLLLRVSEVGTISRRRWLLDKSEAIRRAVVSVSRDRDITRNTRRCDPHAGVKKPMRENDRRRRRGGEGGGGRIMANRILRIRNAGVRARVVRAQIPAGSSLLTLRLLHGRAYRECIHKLRNHGNSYDATLRENWFLQMYTLYTLIITIACIVQ